MAKKVEPTHTLQNEEINNAIVARVKRAQGQLGAVARMLEEGRNCDEIVHQMSAVAKAVNTAAFTLISASLEECILEGKSNQQEVSDKLQKLFLSLA
jgi:DNA-binding FrmR family transcriptional regulator